ncbi:alanine racemase [Acinetobacter bohemicus]|uniref:Alanine racemase n=2 Tax=Acinetobacter TaxID=469 RepID=A0A9D3A020_ACILW|nr:MULTISPECIES: alanine racemase [Acinetobacter]MCO8042199.1 alanine racemase [Acinetobacter sp. S4400-12]MCO8045341.1 alanine racemase [Acinetobacter sp. S4397-1]MCU7224449.1 alanine racemase [Acinetobacter bohemicus]HJF28562.1 alanine racemase [Acinetobacter lwoffii]
MPRPIHAVIHQQALKHNLKVARSFAAQSQVFAVVKADAYGHGIERVYPALQQADGFAFLDIAEGKRLRALGCDKPLLLLEGIFGLEDLFDCAKYAMAFAIHAPHQLEWLKSFVSLQPEAQLDVFLKMNSGMNRLGFLPEQYAAVFQELQSIRQIRSISHMTHFSDADSMRLGREGTEHQQLVFAQTTQGLPGKISLSNSAAILRHQQLHSDIVRSGIMLYGSSPDYPAHSIAHWNLQPAMSLRSELIAVQQVPPGNTIGYGSSFVVEQEMQVGIVACGYADGYQRITQTGTPVLVDGIRTRTLGRVSMDMLAVDLGPVPQAQPGSEVVLWGQSVKGAVLPIDEVAAGSGTVGYELMCAITARVPIQIDACKF